MRALLLCALAAFACGCGRDNSLSGSVGELFPLNVSRVQVLRNEEAFQISYYANRGADVDLVVRVAVSLYGIELKNGTKIPLQGEGAPGHARTTVIHMAAGEPARVFAPVHKGDLVLERGGNPGELSRGNFSMSFQEGDGYGAGRTLEGTFAATTQDAGFGP